MPSSNSALIPYHIEFKAMGSPCTITLYASNTHQGSKIAQLGVVEIARLEKKFSRYLENNTLFHVNLAANQGTSIDVDNEFIALLHYADTCYQQSHGLFDITAGALRHVWNFNAIHGLPTDADIEAALACIGWQYVEIQNNTLHFLRPNMEIDLGGIVKEYASDCVANILANHDIHHGIVNLGGDIKAIGPHPDGTPWTIKIRDAKQPGKHKNSVDLYTEGLATSGDYERFFEIDGQRYCHILSPKTGWPVKGLSSVTVKAPQCVVAGSAATIAMLMESEGITWLNTLGVECFWQD